MPGQNTNSPRVFATGRFPLTQMQAVQRVLRRPYLASKCTLFGLFSGDHTLLRHMAYYRANDQRATPPSFVSLHAAYKLSPAVQTMRLLTGF